MPRKYLLYYAVAHPEFRYPDLQSVSELFNFEITFPKDEEARDPNKPFLIIELEDESHARKIAQRSILVKSVYELWATASNQSDLHAMTRANEDLWRPFSNDSFRFEVTSTGHTIPSKRKTEIINSFAYMDYQGDIDLKNAKVILAYFEEYPEKNILRTRSEGDGDFMCAYFGRQIEEGACRSLINKFNVKQRAYYGNTSMEAEVSLLMANQALAAPGKLIYDPFVGTGSMLYTAAYFGALVVGSDIDGRQMRGKGSGTPGIYKSADQYGVSNRILDCLTFDVTRNPFRLGGVFDAIVSDPPYGVRAGAKRLGRVKQRPVPHESVETHESTSYSRMPYELSDLTIDLVLLARYLLRPGGRLVWFLPTVAEEYQDIDIPVCEGMELVANSEQRFGKWGRRLVTMRKSVSKDYPPPSFDSVMRMAELGEKSEAPSGHRGFREKYFAGFRKPEENALINE